MIKIEITDPHTLPPDELMKLGTYLFAVAGHHISTTPPAPEMVERIDQLPKHVQPVAEDIRQKLEEMLKNRHSAPEVKVDVSLNPDSCEVEYDLTLTHEDEPSEREVYYSDFTVPSETDNKPVTTNFLRPEDYDSIGMPWDSRIHSRTMTKTSDGRWKVKRGLQDTYRNTVEAELINNAPLQDPAEIERARSMPSPSEANRPGSEIVDVPDAYIGLSNEPMEPITRREANAQVPPPPPPPPSIPAPPASHSFGELVVKASAAVNTGKITQKQLNDMVVSLGVPSLPLVGSSPHLIPMIWKLLEDVGA